MNLARAALLLTLGLVNGAATADPTSSLVTFANNAGGAQGWQGMQTDSGLGGTLVDPDFGSDAPALRTKMNNYFIAWWNNTNPAYLGDWSGLGTVTIGVDVFATLVWFGFGNAVPRDLVVELRDYDNRPPSVPWVSVWYNLGTLSVGNGWQTRSVTIADTASIALPAGWGGTGDYLGTGLPPGRSFASVLASVDIILFHTSPPGTVSGFVDYDVALDNIAVDVAPARR
jgi:hypothetical protein